MDSFQSSHSKHDASANESPPFGRHWEITVWLLWMVVGAKSSNTDRKENTCITSNAIELGLRMKITNALWHSTDPSCFLRRCKDGWLTSELTDWSVDLCWPQLPSWPKAQRWSWPSLAEQGWASQVNIWIKCSNKLEFVNVVISKVSKYDNLSLTENFHGFKVVLFPDTTCDRHTLYLWGTASFMVCFTHFGLDAFLNHHVRFFFYTCHDLSSCFCLRSQSYRGRLFAFWLKTLSTQQISPLSHHHLVSAFLSKLRYLGRGPLCFLR